jgi:uncharacterized protein YcbK (DUF882 family)
MRRRFLRHAGRLAASVALPMAGSRAIASAPPDARALSLRHAHTQERIELVYAVGGHYLPEALVALNRFLRDHYTGDVGIIDPGVLDLLHRVQLTLGSRQAFEVISAYRCPATNARLRGAGGGGVARQSLHMVGRAIDVRLPGVALAELRDAALSLRAGGVGYYPGSRFVHVDTGRVRRW